MSLISLGKLKEKMHCGDDVLILDVRTHEEFRDGHISGARSMPMERLTDIFAGCVSRSKTLITYGDGPDSDAPFRAARELENMGHWMVYAYPGGMNEWNESLS